VGFANISTEEGLTENLVERIDSTYGDIARNQKTVTVSILALKVYNNASCTDISVMILTSFSCKVS
jgi:hypothetical protein